MSEDVWPATLYLAGYDEDDAQCREFFSTPDEAEEYAHANGELNVYTCQVLVLSETIRPFIRRPRKY